MGTGQANPRTVVQTYRVWFFLYVKALNTKVKLPFGIPHGGFVLELSRKSRSYLLAGGKVNATCPYTITQLYTNNNTTLKNDAILFSLTHFTRAS